MLWKSLRIPPCQLDVVDDEPAEMVSEEKVKALNQKWLDRVKELSEPVGVQNLTLVDPMKITTSG